MKKNELKKGFDVESKIIELSLFFAKCRKEQGFTQLSLAKKAEVTQ